MSKRIHRLSALALVCLLLTGCAGQKAPQATATPVPAQTATAAPAATADPNEKTTGIGFYFDTAVSITLYGADQALMDDIWAMCRRYEDLLSKTIATSDVSRINGAGGKPVAVDPETWEILRRAKEISAATGGAFSVTIAPLSAMWDFTGGTNRMPAEAERIAALPLVDDQKITLGDGHTVTLPEGMQIDLGGIAKGYIADRVAELTRGRSAAAIISLGGNVYTTGAKPNGSAFSVGVKDPANPLGNPLSVLFTGDCSTVTSGTYERYFTVDGVTYHHILDPKTGLPADSDLVSATFVMESSMSADALATACIVLGSEKALTLASEMKLDGMFITRDGQTLFTPGFVEKYGYILYSVLVGQ